MAPSSLLNKIDVFSLNLQQASSKTMRAQGEAVVVVTLVAFILTCKNNMFWSLLHITLCLLTISFFHILFLAFFVTKHMRFIVNTCNRCLWPRPNAYFYKKCVLLKRQARFGKGATTVQNICVLLFRLHKCHFHIVFVIVLT